VTVSRHRALVIATTRTTSTPETIATAITEELDRPVDYRPVETSGATRAAAMIAELL
jgi:hypothetical protein